MNYSYVLKKLNKNYPVKYIELINRIVNLMISIFDDNLITIVLGGSGGKGNIIDGNITASCEADLAATYAGNGFHC